MRDIDDQEEQDRSHDIPLWCQRNAYACRYQQQRSPEERISHTCHRSHKTRLYRVDTVLVKIRILCVFFFHRPRNTYQQCADMRRHGHKFEMSLQRRSPVFFILIQPADDRRHHITICYILHTLIVPGRVQCQRAPEALVEIFFRDLALRRYCLKILCHILRIRCHLPLPPSSL